MAARPLFQLPPCGELVVLSDVHLGAEECAQSRFEEALAYCKRKRSAILLLGDIVENALRMDMQAEQVLDPTGQIKLARDLLKPFVKREQIVGAVRGNHEARSMRAASLDLTDLLAHSLGIPYFGPGGIFRFKAGMNVYQVAGIHGRSGARANKYLDTERLMKVYPEADVWVAGHNHYLGAKPVYAARIGKNGSEELSERWRVRSGTYLKWDSDYAREAVYEPGVVGSPILRFGNEDRVVEVDTHTLRWKD